MDEMVRKVLLPRSSSHGGAGEGGGIIRRQSLTLRLAFMVRVDMKRRETSVVSHLVAIGCLVTRFSAMALCNLSTHIDCKASLVSLNGLLPLIELLDGESDLVKRYAAMALCNLSTLAANQVGAMSWPINVSGLEETTRVYRLGPLY